jgi:hypothetical protein
VSIPVCVPRGEEGGGLVVVVVVVLFRPQIVIVLILVVFLNDLEGAPGMGVTMLPSAQ